MERLLRIFWRELMDDFDIQSKPPNYPVRVAGGSGLLFLFFASILPIWSVSYVGQRCILTDNGSFWSLLGTLWSNFLAPEMGVKQPSRLLECHAHNLILAPLVLVAAAVLWYAVYRLTHLWIHTHCDRLSDEPPAG
jgi:hypothetical protein